MGLLFGTTGTEEIEAVYLDGKEVGYIQITDAGFVPFTMMKNNGGGIEEWADTEEWSGQPCTTPDLALVSLLAYHFNYLASSSAFIVEDYIKNKGKKHLKNTSQIVGQAGIL